MKKSIGIACFLVFTAAVGVYGPRRGSNPDQQPIVEVVGCLSQTGGNWMLANATDAATSTTSFTTPDALKAAAKPRWRQQSGCSAPSLIPTAQGLSGPGLLIKSGSETRINLLSFQMLSETCAK